MVSTPVRWWLTIFITIYLKLFLLIIYSPCIKLFKKWYKSLGTVGQVMYEKVREEISEEYYNQRNKK